MTTFKITGIDTTQVGSDTVEKEPVVTIAGTRPDGTAFAADYTVDGQLSGVHELQEGRTHSLGAYISNANLFELQPALELESIDDGNAVTRAFETYKHQHQN